MFFAMAHFALKEAWRDFKNFEVTAFFFEGCAVDGVVAVSDMILDVL
jgi:hypothetical protein